MRHRSLPSAALLLWLALAWAETASAVVYARGNNEDDALVRAQCESAVYTMRSFLLAYDLEGGRLNPQQLYLPQSDTDFAGLMPFVNQSIDQVWAHPEFMRKALNDGSWALACEIAVYAASAPRPVAPPWS